MSIYVRAAGFAFVTFLCLVQLPQRASAGEPNVGRQSSVFFCNSTETEPARDELPLEERASAALFEDELLRLVNDARRQGADCGAYGRFPSGRPLLMHPLLRCAARRHAQDMAVRQYFSHHSPEGQTPWRRMRQAGYGSYRFAAENIAVDSERPLQVLERLLMDPPHCANIMSPKFTHIGIGYAAGPPHGALADPEETYRHLTVQDFATPATVP